MNCSFSSSPINKLCNGYPSNSLICLGRKLSENHIRCRNHKQTSSLRVVQKFNYEPRFITRATSSDQNQRGNVRFDQTEPFGGKSGSVSFYGLTHQVIEEGKLISAPFKEGKGSFLWVLAPIALISSLVLPQFFLSNAIESFIRDDILAEIVASFSSETIFYLGLAAFLKIIDHVQKPYLQYSPKRWGLITGLNGYLSSAFFTMGFKVVAPLFAVFVTWPELGLAGPVIVAPFLIGCAVQLAFEMNLEKRGSSCWPLVPIIFEVYRLYQLSKAAHFIERLMMSMMGIEVSAQIVARSKALLAFLVTLQVLGVVCLWSLTTFLLRLFPSRPVAEKY